MKFFLNTILLIAAGAVLLSCSSEQQTNNQESDTTSKNDPLELARDNFAALDLTNVPEKNSPEVVLGKTLFFDTKLSETGEISCNSCHNMQTFGVDNEVLSKGIKGHMTERNSPTVLNSAPQVAQFWDGRAATLREQVRMPIMDQSEMGMTEEALVNRLKADNTYVTQFTAAYPGEEITIDFMADALASFIESEVYYSRFDKFLLGSADLTPIELEGLRVFVEKGCTDCHDGSLLGGDDFEKFGLFENYWTLTKSAKQDSGRYLITEDPEDVFVFKIPSLRNVEKTEPYFHDGSVRDLAEAVKIMGKTQLDVELTDQETKAIVKFLSTLTGDNTSI